MESPEYNQNPAVSPEPAADTQHAFAAPQPPQQVVTPAKKTSKNGWLVAGAIVLTGALSAGIGGAVGSSVTADNLKAPTSTTLTTAETVNNPSVTTGDISSVVRKAMKSIVTVSVVTDQGAGTGSGVSIDNEGHIVTNAHVATLGGASDKGTITVQNSEGDTATATLVGYDPQSDLAVLKTDLKGLEPTQLADSGELQIGDGTIAIGSPLGLSGTVTTGIVSALNRPITLASSEVKQPTLEEQQRPGGIALNVIQTDAAINSGNSGGGLFNDVGQLIGVNVAIASSGGENSGNIGVGFAIPSNHVKKVVNTILTDGQLQHGFLGIGVDDYRQNKNSVFTNGVTVVSIQPNSPAGEAGLAEGDVIVAADNQPVSSATQFIALIRQTDPGSKVTLKVASGGDTRDVAVTLGGTKD